MKKITPYILVVSVWVFPFFSFSQVKSDLFRHNLKGKVHTTLESEYSPAGNLNKLNKKNLKHREFIEYNEQGYIIQMKEYDSKNMLITTRKIILDKDEKRIVAFDYNLNNQIKSIDSFKYDLNGNRIEDLIYNPNYTLVKKMISRYDSNGVVIETCIYNSYNNLVDGYKFRIGNSGERTKADYFNKDSIVVGTNTYQYYDFDKEGNSQKNVTYYNGFIDIISTTKIEYY